MYHSRRQRSVGFGRRKVNLSEEKWLSEQDIFKRKYKGFDYILKRNSKTSSLCGYVKLTKKDKLFSCNNLSFDENVLKMQFDICYVSYENPVDGKVNKNALYIGFDTAHDISSTPKAADKLRTFSLGSNMDLIESSSVEKPLSI